RPSPLPELPIQYADFAIWQRGWLQGDVLDQQLGYWQRQLADLPVLELPTDRPRPPVQSHRGAHEPFALPPATLSALEDVSKQYGVTLFMTLLAAFQVLLSRYSGQLDLAVGSPIANRDLVEVEPLIGFFINTLILRANLRGNPRFVDLLAQTRETTLDAYAHQNVPFEQLVEVLRPERDPSRPPLFQVMFALQPQPTQVQKLPDMTITPLPPESGASKFDLMLGMTASSRGLRATIEYNTDLFERETIQRMVHQFTVLLEGIIVAPERRIAELPMLTADEQRDLAEWNAISVADPVDTCIHDLIAAQAERTPDALAVISGDASLTYAALNARANQLAHLLRAQGVGSDVPVALCLPRSLDQIVALLAIWKAGGAYVPLDPAYPAARLQFLLADSGCPLLVTHTQLLATLPPFDGAVICLDREQARIAQQPATNPTVLVLPEALAYVIYTSGSTGQPKGVPIPQRALLSYVHAAQQLYAITAADRVLQFATLTFDASVEEIVTSLSSGATLVLRSDDMLAPPEIFFNLCRQLRLSVLSLPTAFWHVLAEAVADGTLPVPETLRLVIIGGERALPARVAQWQARLGDRVQLINTYGPTETTVVATAYPVPASVDPAQGDIPIGRSLANLRAYVLDAQMQPVPIGGRGELYLGGLGLARGYLHQPALTATRFVPDAFSGEHGARLYRTGDLARYRPDGTIAFVGRVDGQVKVRGFRIEPDEINAVLEQHPAVQESIVVGAHDPSGQASVVAYVVAPPEHEPSVADLRSFLKQALPEHMVPSAFVFLRELPRTTSGKIDRRALPAPDLTRRVRDNAIVAPRTPAEELVASVWSAVLGVREIGAFDNFFALGGHSLLATQAVARLRKAFDLPIPLRFIFEAPVVAELAARLTSHQQAEQGLPIVPLRQYPRSDHLPLSFAQQRLWFLEHLQPHSPMYLIPLAVRLRGRLDLAVLERSLTTILERHEVLRTTFAAENGEPFQVIAEPQPLTLQIVDRTTLAEQEREAEIQRYVLAETQQPLDLEQGPLLRGRVVRLAADDHVLLLTAHHIAFDGWSYAILTRELIALYTAFSQDQPTPLPLLPIQYIDYALWQREWLSGPVLAQQIDYWRRQLAGVPDVLDLPTDWPRSPVQTSQGATYAFELSQPLSEALQTVSQRENATLFMTLLTAFQVLLSRYSGQHDIVVGTPIAGRTRPELEELIGFFVNTLVLRTDLSGAPTFAELVARVRTVCLDAYTHQDVPFELLVEMLQPTRDLSRTPLFQVMFTLQNIPRNTIDLADLTLEPVAVESTIAKFDLSLTLSEQPSGLQGVVEYRSDLFAAATIERLVGHYQRLLAALVAAPHSRIDDVPLLDAAERRQLLVAWNADTLELPAVGGIHDLVAAQVARTPHAIAVRFGEQQLTYAELNARANQLAHSLRAQGVGPEVRVGLAIEPALELVVAMLGVFKAGGAYVPIDPSYPEERLHWLLADSQVALVLTQEGLAERLPTADVPLLAVDQDWAQIAAQPISDPALVTSPDQLAYMIYTSGSTGTPKGVMVPHRGVINNLMAHQATSCLSAEDRMLLNYAISFDPSVWSIFWPLITGAQLVLVPSEVRYDSAALVSAIAEQQITILGVSPGHLAVLLEEPQITACTALRYVVCGGENLSREVQTRFFARLSAVLCNAYGPTEATIDTTLWHCPRVDTPHGSVIGRPLANVQVYVLDRAMQPVPVGVPGELYIGGVGVARGYHRRPDLTAERFVPDPFGHAVSSEPSSRAHGRLYKTGDLVRYRADGALEFLGRIDQQVKLRGFRIELGEIEAALQEHEAVQSAAVVIREDRPGDRRIVAYVVEEQRTKEQIEDQNQEPRTKNQEPQEDRTTPLACRNRGRGRPRFGEGAGGEGFSSTLRQLLQQRLPAYMVPSAFVLLDALPLTPHGKLDRKALPAPEATLADRASSVAPRDRWEWQLAQIWQDLLGRPQVGVTESFFEIGGHSLLAIRLIAQIQQQFGRTLPLTMLFQAQTIAQLAAHLRQEAAEQPWSPLVVLQPHGTQRPFFCVHPVGGTVLCYAELARLFGEDRPFYGLQARGAEPGQTPHTTIGEMAAEYVAAIRAVQPEGLYLLGGWSLGGLVAFEMARQLQQQGQRVERLVLIDSSPPPPQSEPIDEEELLVRFARDLGGLFGKLLPITADELRSQAPDMRLDYVLDQARQHSLVPPDVDLEQMRRLAALFQANQRAAQTYTPQPIAQPVILLEADDSPGAGARPDLADLWQPLTAGVEAYQVPGNHYTLLHAPQVQTVAERLKHSLS
ncbi:MAG TPA: amino acid adenylation domain-containing protein, partial [Herpetosiphonaceae bacterium]